MRENHKAAKCHPERRHAARGMCFECYSEAYPKAQRAECHPGRIAHAQGKCRVCYDRDLKLRNPEYAAKQKLNYERWSGMHNERLEAYRRRYYRLDRVKNRSAVVDRERLLAGFGLTWADEHRILERQNHKCGICGGEPSRRFFDLDHDHDTGKVRGLLCHRCNKGLGLLGDSVEAIERALAYLRCDAVDRETP